MAHKISNLPAPNMHDSNWLNFIHFPGLSKKKQARLRKKERIKH